MKRFFSSLIYLLIIVGLLFLPAFLLTKKKMIIIGDHGSLQANSVAQTFIVHASTISEDRVNVIFLGIPGQNNSAPNLTDTLMVMSIDERTKTGFLLSIPRDLLVKIPESSSYTKINNIYQVNGIMAVESVLSKITGLDFNYNIVIDLQGVKRVIDKVDGIDIYLENDIYDPVFPGPANSYQLFTLSKGLQHLDGETALKYIRTRYGAGGDFTRMIRQQKVLIALKEKISLLNPIWDSITILELWGILSGHFKTNLSLGNIKTFWKVIKDVDLESIEFKVLDLSTGLLVSGQTILGGKRAYIVKPAAGLNNYEDIKKYISRLIN